jgi:DNA-binding winged helix-turn-helix (wHTH) protein/TolB-like protein/Flp pilus assembly protein TadD
LQNTFRIGESHYIEPSLNSVTGPAGAIRLEPKVMQVLVCLAENAGEVVSKERLMRRVWPDAFVGDDVLTRCISELRRVFGDDAKEPRFIQTIPKNGYRLIARVSNGAEKNVAARGNADIENVLLGDDRVIAPLTKTGRASVAVLPFEHLGGPEREYLTDGLTEETSASLGQIDPEHLIVKGRTSTRRYKSTTKSLAEIGQELGVEYLLEGSVRAESRRLRVTSKLIRVRDQVQIWAESFESEPGSMLELQCELSAAIARQVRLRLSPARLTALAPRHTRNAEAYEFYLRGRHLWNQLTPETNRRAVAAYQKATQLDPEFALAWAGLADIHSASPINSDVRPRDVLAQARDAAARAVASGSDLAETQTALGTVHYWFDFDSPAAETAYRKAISVDPSYSQAHRLLGLALAAMGRHEEAREAMLHARELDPYYPMQPALSAYERLQARDYSSALELAQRATAVGPSFWIGHFQLAAVYERLGNSELALEALEKAEALSGNSKMLSLRGYILAKSGRTNLAEHVLRTLKSTAAERYVPPYAMALVHAGLGQRDSAFEWLERAYAEQDVHLVFLEDPKWDALREDPRFRGVVERRDFMRTARTGGP